MFKSIKLHSWERMFREWCATQDVFEDVRIVLLHWDEEYDCFRTTIDMKELSLTVVFPYDRLTNGYEDASNLLWDFYWSDDFQGHLKKGNIRHDTKIVTLRDGITMQIIED